MRAGNGVHAPTDIREVRADDALIGAMGTAPLECGPTVEDGAGGELIGNMMAWRRWLEDEETAPPRGGSVLEELLSAHLAGWVDAARPAAAVASVRAAVAPLCTPAAFRAPSSCRLTRRGVRGALRRGLPSLMLARWTARTGPPRPPTGEGMLGVDPA